MQEIWTATFATGYGAGSDADRDKIGVLLDTLMAHHTQAKMRETPRLFPGREVWSTHPVPLSHGRARITWEYNRDRSAIHLIAVARIE
jgi:hypothetical protein